MILILGTGGCAREVFFHLLDAYDHNSILMPNISFYDDISGLDYLQIGNKSYPVISNFNQITLNTQFLVGVADPKIKQILVTKAIEAGLKPADTVIHPSAILQDKTDIKIGKGGVIGPFCLLTTHIEIADYVTVNFSCSIGHDVLIENFVTVNPGSRISGNVYIKTGAFIGAGSTVLEKRTIAHHVIVGAHSCVTKDLTHPNAIYYGVPASLKK